mmetsp:Transcript_2591/g.6215  ORF Transcript_2591/g.6215 Transcript_2591/m.6215 type:complete len:530 (+) Transcript_2591:169-1758(+)
MPAQHQSCQYDTASTRMVSPSSISSGSTSSSNSSGQDFHPTTWQQDLQFLEDLQDVMSFLMMQENSYNQRRFRKYEEHRRKQQNVNSCITHNLPPFYDAWRPVMVSWMYHVADTFRLMPIVVATGMYILDTCALDLCNPSSRTYNQKELYPLMTMTAFNMAVKCHETKMFPLDQLVQLLGTGGGSASEQSYTPEDVMAMERRLLQRCGWKLHCPTTHDFLLRFVTVLSEQYQGPVTECAVKHLKQSLLWEHMLHQDEKERGLFKTSTLAYAAFLLAMEDVKLPLADKQTACLAILEVANLSAQTPQLSEAYNWLYKAKSLQAQLEQGNSLRRATKEAASTDAVPTHVSTERAQDEPSVDLLDDSSSNLMSCDTRQPEAAASSPDVAIIEPDTDDESTVADDDLSAGMMSYGSSSISDHSIIFCSHSVDGDSVEVVATDLSIEEEDDNESMDHSATMTILPTVEEDEEQEALEANTSFVTVEDCEEEEHEPARLVLSESLDEDGFEVSFEKDIDRLSSFVASPREVSAAL